MGKILFFSCFLLTVYSDELLVSSTIRDNKLYTIHQEKQLGYVRCKVYELKEGPIIDIVNSAKTFNLTDAKGFKLKFIDVSDSSQDSHNKIWVKSDLDENIKVYGNSSYMNWVGYISLEDMSLKTDLSFINFPTKENFPINSYTLNKITNESGSTLYITGGYVYTKDNDSYSLSSSFYKYSFASKEWTDMAYSINGKLKPLYSHKSELADNRYLVILGGKRRIIYDSEPNGYDSDHPEFEYNSLYNLTVFDTFTNIWENVNIKADMFDKNTESLQFYEFLATAYNDKIIVLGGMTSENRSNLFYENGHLGILDLKSRSWAWSPILNEYGNNYGPVMAFGDIIVFNDQLIICSDNFNEESRMPIHIYDIPSQRMKSKLRFSDSLNDNDANKRIETQSQSRALPIYAIVLIALSCIALILGLIYLIFYKKMQRYSFNTRKPKYNDSMLEVWADSELDNALNIITRDKKSGLAAKMNNHNNLNSNTDTFRSDLIEFNK